MTQRKYNLAFEPQKFVTMVDAKELTRQPGKVVTSLEDLKDVESMKQAINANAFQGLHRAGFAIAHQQVSKDHFRYFVVGELWKSAFKDNSVIVNPEIVEYGEQKQMRQGCLSHPYKDYRLVPTYDKLKVKFQNEKLEPVEMELESLPAMVFFHEFQHCEGHTIYDDKVAKKEDSVIEETTKTE